MLTVDDAASGAASSEGQPTVPDELSDREATGSRDDRDGTRSARRQLADRWGRPTTHGWITTAIGALTAALYVWNLDAVGNANSYYAAAVKSASVSWKAWFFGSLDTGSFITVDKPPAAFWVQGLSARIFGFGTASMIVPEVLCGVASVLILHHLVRKWKGDTAAHLAVLALALTPIAAAMFRNNNPDAFLTLLGVAGTWAMWRALETGRTRYLIAAAALTGLAFNAKMLQAFIVLPAFVLVYTVAGPPKLGRRLLQMLAALGTLIVSAGWWVAVVTVWPTASRPFVGSTQDNSVLNLVLGYNGLDRVFGSGAGGGRGGAPGGGGGGFGGTPGWGRLFNSEAGGLISWLIPMAIFATVAGLWLTLRNRRTDLDRAGWLLWGGWALAAIAVFSLSQGIFHPYYTVQLAPPIAALAGAGGITLWKLGRRHVAMMWALPVAIAISAYWAVTMLRRTPHFASWLPSMIGAGVAISGIVIGYLMKQRRLVIGAGVIAAATLLAGPAAFAATTVEHPVSGSMVTAGPSQSFGFGGFGGGPRGGAGDAGQANTALTNYLVANRGDATYIVAGFGSGATEAIIIATGKPVMTIGGFSGGDPAPTLDQFEAMVAAGKVRYVLFGGGGGGPGGRGSDSISQWVRANGTDVQVPGFDGTLYDMAGK